MSEDSSDLFGALFEAAPLGPGQIIGAVWDGEDDSGVDPKKLRPINHVFDCLPLGSIRLRALRSQASSLSEESGLVALAHERRP